MKTRTSHNRSQLQSIRSTISGWFSFLSILVIILVPKCAFCLMAYASTILLFLDLDLSTLSPLFIHLKTVLIAIVFLSIFLVYKGPRTIFSLGLVILCGVFISLENYAQWSILPQELVYLGLIFATWYNGNFTSFYNFVKEQWHARSAKPERLS